jgi:DNA uptake protein ComE-like DNA-binding protein
VTRLWWAGTLVPFGFLTPLLFAFAAVRAPKPWWWGAAGLYAVVIYTGLVLSLVTREDSKLDKFGSFLMVMGWVAGATHAFVARSEFERRLRSPLRVAIDQARETIELRRRAQQLVEREPQLALQMGVGRPDVRGATDMGVIDVNHAGARAIARLPRVTPRLAREIVRAREEIDGFASVADLGEVLRLDANLVEDLRPYVVFVPR